MKMYSIELTEEQVKVVLQALELRFRLEMGQTDILNLVSKDASWSDWEKLRRILFPQLSDKEYIGIHNISDAGKRAHDIHQAIRYHYAWSKEENTPDQRKWPEQMYVQYDEPLPILNEELPTVKVKEIEERNPCGKDPSTNSCGHRCVNCKWSDGRNERGPYEWCHDCYTYEGPCQWEPKESTCSSAG